MLWAAAAFNWLAALPSLFLATSASDRVVALLVGCFGLVYALVARMPERLGPVLWAGVVGKIGVVAQMLPEVRAGRALPGIGWLLAGDALFTVLFVAFLFRPKEEQ